jgi:hypothetical protein
MAPRQDCAATVVRRQLGDGSPTPRAVRYPRVQGSRILDIRSSRWYSDVEASSSMYGFVRPGVSFGVS